MFIRHEVNAGACRTLNEALEGAAGELVTITSADDWMEPSGSTASSRPSASPRTTSGWCTPDSVWSTAKANGSR
jgi:hypothetical protein